jgi:DNA-binding HxlR family transcriptional regulator
VEYSLTSMGRELEPALAELKRWGRRWLADSQPEPAEAPEPADAIV